MEIGTNSSDYKTNEACFDNTFKYKTHCGITKPYLRPETGINKVIYKSACRIKEDNIRINKEIRFLFIYK